MTGERIVVHGGAWAIPDRMVEAHLKGCAAAAKEGGRVLSEGGSALDAVEAAVRVMEEDPTFDAGHGSFLNREGAVEMDAVIMDGSRLRAGSVAAVRNILHPVTLARLVMERTDHVLLVGEGANLFAAEMGIEATPEEELLVGRELERWRQLKKDPRFKARVIFEPPKASPSWDVPGDTVGAVALDGNGNTAAATSTGGTPKKRMGRVGDSPLVGAGAYADDVTGAVSATGWGEPIILACLSRRVLEFMERGMGPAEASQAALSEMLERHEGRGGVILVTPDGSITASFNTPRMAYALWRAGDDGILALIDDETLP
ncbi:MAG: peptidase T [Thermoplasmata archaeon]|nr:peptidase T [Thermoplasmata archaeon]NIS10360.1 peptidase T [Thermoplasmata archaeon]NIS18352.1 peptidase T [Thermoplasmata archaeon]NIT75327.1 peptidase T [Thermoplasmata archaeon]NIU47507.1 peptidase T [Thermoplasmata archaeon]